MISTDTLPHRLGARLGDVIGEGALEVRDLRRLTGGASRQTWSFEVDALDGRSRRLVLRVDPPHDPQPANTTKEASVWRAAGAHGVPGPRLIDWSADPAVLGAPYLVLDYVEGETIARRILRDVRYAHARRGLVAELGRAAARIHAIAPTAVPELIDQDFVEHNRRRYEAIGVVRPVLELAWRWLETDPPPPPERPALVHGDFRLGNMIVDEHGLRAVLDWEMSHLGDPMEDLGWLCVRAWRYGEPRPVAGLGDFPELFAAYAEVSGVRPDPERVRWWQIAGTLSWAVGCLNQAQRHLSGTVSSVSLLAAGRFVAQQELDLLRMLPRSHGRSV